MGGFDPIYDGKETEGMSEDDLRKLRQAVLRELNADKEIRGLLKKKTQSLYNSLLKPKKS